ncbi:MAG: arginine--tRNA ligase, partial [Candidatus Azotimanducaceae bacterium]
MIVEEIKNEILDHIEKHYSEEEVSAASSKFQIEIPDSPEKGNLTCNIALILGNITKNNPKEIGLEIGNILKELSLISSIEVAGPGFINIFLNHSGTLKIIKDVLDKNTIREEEDSKRIQVEFVSANPTGPLHVGHGRGAIYGDVISKLLEKKGHEVQKEYYVNDAGRQIDILTASVYLRAINIEDNIFPESAYRGKYIKEIAKSANLQEAVNIDDLFKNLPEDEEEKIDEIISYLRSSSEKD